MGTIKRPLKPLGSMWYRGFSGAVLNLAPIYAERAAEVIFFPVQLVYTMRLCSLYMYIYIYIYMCVCDIQCISS